MSAELVERFENPSRRYGPLPLWWWSGDRLERDRLRWQMEQLLDQGVHQAVVMNLAPTGPLYGALADDPPFMSEEWWSIFTDVCGYAEELGFQIWIYDQIGFSGANLQGRIVAAEPGHAGRTLSQTRADTTWESRELSAPEGTEPVGAWFAPADGSPALPVKLEGGTARHERSPGELVLCFAAIRGFDYFSPSACATLIDTVFGEYERRVGHTFGRGIGGVFQDELPDVPTWSVRFSQAFREYAGYSIEAVLPALWGDRLGVDAPVDGDRARLDYHRTRARLARGAFFDPLANWLDAAGLPCGFDQQSPAREGEPIGATSHYADYLQTHSTYAIPGSDHWGDSKVHSSLGHAHGHERVWIEAFHSSGWGGTLEETYDWLSPYFRRGANLYDPHAVYYSTRSGWFEWAPPSTCWRQPYWPDYHAFSLAVRRLSSVLTAGEHVASTVLYFPTEFVQSRLTAGGEDLGAGAAESSYHALNGFTPWFAERRGLLERAGIDYDVLGAYSLRDAVAIDGELRLRGERYRNVILPGVELLPAAFALLLAEFARQGGRVLCLGPAPIRFVVEPGENAELELQAARAFQEEIASGAVRTVGHEDDVAAGLAPSSVAVYADAPVLHRSIGDAHLVAAIAHDERSGTVQPMLPDLGEVWSEGAFDWQLYWRRLSTEGYEFVPPTNRPLTVRFEGLEGATLTAQLWDPRRGSRQEVPLNRLSDGGLEVDVDFRGGSFAMLVVAPDLPPATDHALGDPESVQELTGDWSLHAESTLDNRWGDLDAPDRVGIVPIQVWEFEHTGADRPSASRVVATFGPFAEVTDSAGVWRPAEWSLSRGIRNDSIHDESLGPNGYVPEEFLSWSGVVAGRAYRVRTSIRIPSGPTAVLAVGANAPRRASFDGRELHQAESAYLTFSELPAGADGVLELEFTAVEDGDLRGFFALTTDAVRFARPEWIEAADAPVRSTALRFSTEFELERPVEDARVQLSTEAPSVLFVNGAEIGRQSDFDPYAERRFTRVHPYDLTSSLREGRNVIEVRSTDVGRPVALRLDSVPRHRGGLGIVSDASWSATREGEPVAVRNRYAQYEDPRYGCIVPRPHPLQAATWLEPEAADSSVWPLVPDIDPAPGRIETLDFLLPIGTVEVTVPTQVPFTVAGGNSVVDGDRIRLTEPAGVGQRMRLRFEPADGRRGGALLDGPVSVLCAEAESPLLPWRELGLGALGGAVHYRRGITMPAENRAGRTVLDLGAVRGTVEVRVDGELVDTLFAGPWRTELTGFIHPGRLHELDVTVRGTLAPYLDVASPTSAVMAGQTVHGLFGPVRVESHALHPRR